MLAHERSAGLTDASLLGGHGGSSRIDIDLQIPGVKTGQHLPCRYGVADIHVALNDLAIDPERQTSLHTCLNIARQRHAGREVGTFYRLHINPWQLRSERLFLATPRQHRQGSSETDCIQSRKTNGHADSLCGCHEWA
ncbi:hypothetical protein ALP29_201400 [Pseudomonas syringae pv. avii]|uniref:Uncharacterized protein n=1 Tax=Pseudomonas syringae pv. avii TaxID=663959 RepID=A0A3M5VQZ6_PSESX|nr:hypothetical protein ALP29_201400 [Pseudomonas syringae pv. avii]